MTCIKTGARVYFREYGFLAAADIYSVGNCNIIRWNLHKEFCSEETSGCTHVVTMPPPVQLVGDVWHRDDLGVTVVPDFCGLVVSLE